MAHPPDLDAMAVQQDAALVSALATRSDLDAFTADDVAWLLAAWVRSIDDGISYRTPWTMPTAAAPAVALPRRPGRRRAGLVAGATAAVLVATGGAAAAVTGDPLAIVHAPVQALQKISPFGDGPDDAHAKLPDTAAPRARANKYLADAQRALAGGDRDEAARYLAQAQLLLGDEVNSGQQHRIDKLSDRLDGAATGNGDPGKGPDAGTEPDPGHEPGRGPDQGTDGGDVGKPGPGRGPDQGTDGGDVGKPGPGHEPGGGPDQGADGGAKHPSKHDPKQGGSDQAPTAQEPATSQQRPGGKAGPRGPGADDGKKGGPGSAHGGPSAEE